jgi:hypothetical protein
MRFNNISTVVFTDLNGNKFPIKDIRPVEVFQTAFTLKLEKAMYIDEIVSRDSIFGKNTEEMSYAVVDHNIADIVEAGFDLTKLKSIKIPVLGD